MAGDVVRNYKIRYGAEDNAKRPIDALGKTLDAGLAHAEAFRAKLKELAGQLLSVAEYGHEANLSVRDLNSALRGMPQNPSTDKIVQSIGRIDFNAKSATSSVDGLNAKLAGIAATAPGVGQAQASVQKLQRSAFGAWKNAEQTEQALVKIGATSAGVQGAATSVGNLNTGLTTTRTESKKATSNLGGLLVAMMALRAGESVLDAMADATRRAREDTAGWAEEALKLRDELRELANLRGKPGADDQVVGEQLRLRAQTGMTGPEARKFQEQFLGSLPLAKDAGGIDDKVAGEMAGQVGRLSTRVGLEGGTAGDLAGVMGMFGKIPDAQVGLGRAQQVVDLLNDGRGNLTPLTRALIKGAASTVGEGKAFGSLSERAAAISVASGIGDKNATDTTLGAAIRGLSPGGTKAHQETLAELGIGGNQSFQERLDRLKPLFEKAKAAGKSPQDALLDAGFGNITDRRALIGFYENRETLRKRIDSVKEDPNAPDAKARAAAVRSTRLNDQFYGTDKAARNRLAEAQLAESEFRQGKKLENLAIARKEAEAAMRNRGELDTPEANRQDWMMGGFGLSEKLGGPSGRQIRIDNEVKRRAMQSREAELGRPLKDDERREFSENVPKFSADYLASKRQRDAAGAMVKPGVQVPGGAGQAGAPVMVQAPPIQFPGGGGAGQAGAANVANGANAANQAQNAGADAAAGATAAGLGGNGAQMGQVIALLAKIADGTSRNRQLLPLRPEPHEIRH